MLNGRTITCVATEQSSWLEWNEVKVTQSCLAVLWPQGLYITCQAPPSMQFSRQEYWHGSHFLLHGIFPAQGSHIGLLHCRHTLYCLHHQGRFEWINLPSKFVGQLICTHCFHHLRPCDIKWLLPIVLDKRPREKAAYLQRISSGIGQSPGLAK